MAVHWKRKWGFKTWLFICIYGLMCFFFFFFIFVFFSSLGFMLHVHWFCNVLHAFLVVMHLNDALRFFPVVHSIEIYCTSNGSSWASYSSVCSLTPRNKRNLLEFSAVLALSLLILCTFQLNYHCDELHRILMMSTYRRENNIFLFLLNFSPFFDFNILSFYSIDVKSEIGTLIKLHDFASLLFRYGCSPFVE